MDKRSLINRVKALEARKVRNQPEIFEWFEYLYNETKKREQRK
jgi:hypothetical protein